jgi:multimeric flavodoxin WrbA
MSRILGLVGSARPWGNSELLVRQVLRGAQEEGATGHMIRLSSLNLKACTGCMACVIGGKPCPLDDDMAWLVNTIRAADGLVLAVPTYFLGPAAVLKLVLDRLLMVTGRVNEEPLPIRPAVTIATAGLEGWKGVALPFLNALASALSFRPIDSLTAMAPGPGEVLLDEPLMARMSEIGRRLGRGEMEPAPTPPNTCPVCRCDAFVLHGERAICPICAREATVEHDGQGMRLRFDPATGAEQRWTPEGLRKHMIDWVMATGPRFMAHRAEIKERRRPYRTMDVEWSCPWPLTVDEKAPTGRTPIETLSAKGGDLGLE